jgi:hypothetical protein
MDNDGQGADNPANGQLVKAVCLTMDYEPGRAEAPKIQLTDEQQAALYFARKRRRSRTN